MSLNNGGNIVLFNGSKPTTTPKQLVPDYNFIGIVHKTDGIYGYGVVRCSPSYSNNYQSGKAVAFLGKINADGTFTVGKGIKVMPSKPNPDGDMQPWEGEFYIPATFPVQRDNNIYLKTLKSKDKGVYLQAFTADGQKVPDGCVVKFFGEGMIYLYHTLNPDLGLPVDGNGRLVVVR